VLGCCLEQLGSEPKALLRYRAFVERVEGTADVLLFDRWVTASSFAQRREA
jgi:hypothetical protein